MIVGFSKHGTGRGSGPVGYMTDPKPEGRENEPPVVLRGDPEQTKNLIDSLDFKWKYTSGVLSFAPGETITPKMEQTIIDRFEKVAFAGLEKDQFNCLWVRHSHAGHAELHFCAPRVELTTGKSLNIKPPGDLAKSHFDDFRSEINARYGLADPTDPNRAQTVKSPSHILKTSTEDVRRALNDIIEQRIIAGDIKNRADVINSVQELGFEVPRQGKNYITVESDGNKIRMKGALYERDWHIDRALEATSQNRERDYSKPDARSAQIFAERVEKHIAARAEYNYQRYPKPEQKHRLERVQEPVHVADHSRPEPLARFVRGELGEHAIPLEPDSHSERDNSKTTNPGREDQDQPVWRNGAALRKNQRNRGSLPGRLQDTGWILNDRTRNPLVERLEAFGAAIQRATASVRAGAKRLTDDVRAYFAREQELAPASQQLERAAPAIRQAVQHKQALDQQRQREISRSRSGPSLGM